VSYRNDRIGDQVQREVDRIIRNDLNDPRISGTFSVTRADVTRDLRYARIYVSILEEDKAAGVMAALKGAAGYVRRELGRSMAIRYTPEIIFVRDQNIAYGVHIADVLNQVLTKEPEGNTSDEEEPSDQDK
jgi:ribosome-binding factor A